MLCHCSDLPRRENIWECFRVSGQDKWISCSRDIWYYSFAYRVINLFCTPSPFTTCSWVIWHDRIVKYDPHHPLFKWRDISKSRMDLIHFQTIKHSALCFEKLKKFIRRYLWLNQLVINGSIIIIRGIQRIDNAEDDKWAAALEWLFIAPLK